MKKNCFCGYLPKHFHFKKKKKKRKKKKKKEKKKKNATAEEVQKVVDVCGCQCPLGFI